MLVLTIQTMKVRFALVSATITRRVAIFLLISSVTFLAGVAVTRLASRLLAEQHQPSPWQVLLSFENQDLQGLNDVSRSKVRDAVMAVTNQQDSDFIDPFRPALFRSISNTNGEKRYLLVEEAPLMDIPGESRLRVHIFNTCGRLLSKDEFGAGWRTSLRGFLVRQLESLDHDTFIVDGEYVFGGHPSHQFYQVIDDRLTLVYLEADGQFDRNSYSTSHSTIGPQLIRSPDEWEKALNSSDKAEVLSALMWLSGYHRNGETVGSDEDKAEMEKTLTLRSRASVQRKLKELSQLDEQANFKKYWIRTAATAALKNDK